MKICIGDIPNLDKLFTDVNDTGDKLFTGVGFLSGIFSPDRDDF